MQNTDAPIKLIPKKKIVVTIIDDRILQYFEKHTWINPERFIERQILDIVMNFQNSGSGAGMSGGSSASSTKKQGDEETPTKTDITEADMKNFYKEYTTFLTEQKNILGMLKDNIRAVENIRFDHIDNVLSRKFDMRKNTMVCNICNTRSFRNLKALSTHQRKCKRENEKGEANEDDASVEENEVVQKEDVSDKKREDVSEKV